MNALRFGGTCHDEERNRRAASPLEIQVGVPVQSLQSSYAMFSTAVSLRPPRRKIRAPFLGSRPEASTELRGKRHDRCIRVHSRVMQKGILPFRFSSPLATPPSQWDVFALPGCWAFVHLYRSWRRIFYDDPLFYRTFRHQILIANSLANSQSNFIPCEILINVSLCNGSVSLFAKWTVSYCPLAPIKFPSVLNYIILFTDFTYYNKCYFMKYRMICNIG